MKRYYYIWLACGHRKRLPIGCTPTRFMACNQCKTRVEVEVVPEMVLVDRLGLGRVFFSPAWGEWMVVTPGRNPTCTFGTSLEDAIRRAEGQGA